MNNDVKNVYKYFLSPKLDILGARAEILSYMKDQDIPWIENYIKPYMTAKWII